MSKVPNPLTSTWPQLNSGVSLEEGECVAFQQCTITRAVLSGWSTGSGFDLSPPSTSVSWTLWCCVHVSVFLFQIIVTSLYLVEGLAWWDWLFTWWTDQLLSFSASSLLVESSDL